MLSKIHTTIHFNITSTSHQHHINIISTSQQHHINITSTSYQHHINITSTSKSHQHNISINITSTSHQHHINITSTSKSHQHQNYINITSTSTSHQHHINITSTSLQHHNNITSTSKSNQHNISINIINVMLMCRGVNIGWHCTFFRITPALSDLHWLPVRHKINFKIATITFKVLLFQQPSYLAALIPRYVPTRSLRSSSSLSICVPTQKPQWLKPNHFHLLPHKFGKNCHVIFHPFPFVILSGRDSSTTFYRVPF